VRVALHLEARELAMGKAKGAVLLGPVKFLRKRRAAAAALLPQDMQHYLVEDVRLSAWYPESHFIALVHAAAQLLPLPIGEAVEAMGLAGAQAHADVYGDLIHSLASTSSMFALWSAQHDTGELRGVLETRNSGRVELVGYDSTSETTCRLAAGYIRGGLLANGLEHVEVEKLHCVLRGDALCAWRARWKSSDGAPLSPGRRRTR